MKLAAWAAFTMAIGIGVGNAQAPAVRDFRIIRLDPALDTIVSPDAKLETLGEHFGLTEGPVWVQESNSGYLLFSDLTANVIYKRTPDGVLSAFAENIYNGSDLLNVGQQTRSGRMAVVIIGSNGLTWIGRAGSSSAPRPAAWSCVSRRTACVRFSPTGMKARGSTGRTTSS